MKSGLVLVRRHSVTIFFALACAPIWTIVSLGLSARLGVMLSALAPATAAVLLTWIYLPTGGSVVIAALFHGSLNAVSSLVLAGVNPASFNLVYSSGFVSAAVVVIAATGRDLRRRAPPSAAS